MPEEERRDCRSGLDGCGGPRSDLSGWDLDLSFRLIEELSLMAPGDALASLRESLSLARCRSRSPSRERSSSRTRSRSLSRERPRSRSRSLSKERSRSRSRSRSRERSRSLSLSLNRSISRLLLCSGFLGSNSSLLITGGPMFIPIALTANSERSLGTPGIMYPGGINGSCGRTPPPKGSNGPGG